MQSMNEFEDAQKMFAMADCGLETGLGFDRSTNDRTTGSVNGKAVESWQNGTTRDAGRSITSTVARESVRILCFTGIILTRTFSA